MKVILNTNGGKGIQAQVSVLKHTHTGIYLFQKRMCKVWRRRLFALPISLFQISVSKEKPLKKSTKFKQTRLASGRNI